MVGEESIQPLVRLVYEAALDPACWSTFLEQFSLAVNAPCSAIGIHDFHQSNGSAAESVGLDPYWAKRYSEYYSSINVWMEKAPHLLVPGVVAQTQQATTDQELEKSEFFNDYLRPQNFFYCFGGTFGKEEDVISFLTSFRSRQAGPFGESEIAVVKYLMPHLECALRVHSRLSGLEERLNATSHALDCLPWAIVLLDSQHRPVLLNRALHRICDQRDGLSLTAQGLTASTPRLTEALRTLIGSAIPANRHTRAQGGTLAIPRPSGRRPYELLIIPLPGHTRLSEVPSAVAALFISDPEEIRSSDPDVLSNLYGLTRAEARIAVALLEGKTVEDAAEEFEISVNTARTQVNRILSKTQTKRQTELLRLLMNSSARLGHTAD